MLFFFFMIRRTPRSTLFRCTTLFRSKNFQRYRLGHFQSSHSSWNKYIWSGGGTLRFKKLVFTSNFPNRGPQDFLNILFDSKFEGASNEPTLNVWIEKKSEGHVLAEPTSSSLMFEDVIQIDTLSKYTNRQSLKYDTNRHCQSVTQIDTLSICVTYSSVYLCHYERVYLCHRQLVSICLTKCLFVSYFKDCLFV